MNMHRTLRAALGAGALAVSLPLAAAAQSGNPDYAVRFHTALAQLPSRTQALVALGTISDGQIAIAYLANGPDAQAALAGTGVLGPEEANLQKALHTLNVQRTSQTQPISLYAQIKSMGLDPTKVLAVDILSNQSGGGTVTLYYDGPMPTNGGATGS